MIHVVSGKFNSQCNDQYTFFYNTAYIIIILKSIIIINIVKVNKNNQFNFIFNSVIYD